MVKTLAILLATGAAASGATGPASGPSVEADLARAARAVDAMASALHAYRLPPAVASRTDAGSIVPAVEALAGSDAGECRAYARRFLPVLERHRIPVPERLRDLLDGDASGKMTDQERVRLTAISEHILTIGWLGRTGPAPLPAALRQDLWATVGQHCPSSLAVRSGYIGNRIVQADG